MIKDIANNKKSSHGFFNKIVRFLCLLLPIAFAFVGYYTSPYIWSIFKNNEVPEIFKFICSIIFFLIPTTIMFIETRKLNPTIKITIKDNTEKKESSEQEDSHILRN